MPSKREDEAKIAKLKTEISTQFRRYELENLKDVTMKIISGLATEEEQNTYMDEWINYLLGQGPGLA